MQLWARLSVVVLVTFLATTRLNAGPGGPGSGGGQGGHGGSGPGGHGFGGGHGGHAGFSSGHSSGHSSAHAVGQAIGHSFGNLFGHHGKAPSPPPAAPSLAAAAFEHGRAPKVAGPWIVFPPPQHRFPDRHLNDFPFGDRFFPLPHRDGFGFDGCEDFGFSRHAFFFGDEFNCFGGGFFIDPVFIGGFGSFADGPASPLINDQRVGSVADGSTAGPSPKADASRQGMEGTGSMPQVTLLELLDGSMYRLTDYWIENGQLHYTTTSGGQDSVTMDRIDWDKTIRLNADRGVGFVPRLKASSR